MREFKNQNRKILEVKGQVKCFGSANVVITNTLQTRIDFLLRLGGEWNLTREEILMRC